MYLVYKNYTLIINLNREINLLRTLPFPPRSSRYPVNAQYNIQNDVRRIIDFDHRE